MAKGNSGRKTFYPWGLVVVLTILVPAHIAGGAPKQIATGGTIEGTVTYKADSRRPWRYGRFYIEDAKKGNLAEAVVALKGDKLKLAAPKARSATVVMDQKDDQFTPETIVLRSGDVVKFKNSDARIHNVRASHTLHAFNVNMPAGSDYQKKFAGATGTTNPVFLGCIYHSWMRAWIFVFDHPYFALTEADGHFRLEDVPPGEYRLELSHPAGALRWKQKIVVEAGKTQKLDISVSPDNVVKPSS